MSPPRNDDRINGKGDREGRPYEGLGEQKEDVMKNYLKGVATGLVVALAIAIVPVFAQSLNIGGLNSFRIRTAQGDVVQWGENYDLNGTQMPTSIIYNDTTYVPLRKISDLLGTDVYFDGVSNTISLMNAGTTNYADSKVVMNNSFNKEYEYLISTDALLDAPSTQYKGRSNALLIGSFRGYAAMGGTRVGGDPNWENQQRAYSMAGSKTYQFLDDGVVFVKGPLEYNYGTFEIVKISYNFDASTEDGEVVRTVPNKGDGATRAIAIEDGKFVYAYYVNSGDWIYETIDIATGDIHQCTQAEKDAYVQQYGSCGN